MVGCLSLRVSSGYIPPLAQRQLGTNMNSNAKVIAVTARLLRIITCDDTQLVI